VALQGQSRSITNTGYGISAVAILLHISELFTTSSAPHQIALLLVAIGFATLTAIAAVVKTRRGRTEWLSLACLLLFVTSFPHFGYQHFRSPWSAEIGWHHIGIPVALVVLLQDYRFLLLDTFIRFLMNSGLAAAYVAILLLLTEHFHLWNLIGSSVFLTGVALVAVCVSLILFAHARNRLQQWIGRVIFHRRNLEERIHAITQLPEKIRTEDELLSGAAREVAAYLRAGAAEIVDRNSDLSWAEAQTPLRFSGGEVRYLLTGARRGRQRYLSEDLEDMRRLASVIVEQVERFRSQELRRLATQAELRALQAQINPHFLFNAFNTLYGTIDRGSVEARRLVLNLTEIFRYFLQGDRSLIPLSEELRIIKAYLEIETLRLGNRLQTEIDVSESALRTMIPVLSIQPLVENAVKHGVATKSGPGRVILRAHSEDGKLRVTIEDESAGVNGHLANDGLGLGLANVRRRLNLSYGPESTLDVTQGPRGSIVTLFIPSGVQEVKVAS
jgi:two-component system, LytTR family, sensor kinase